MTRCNGGDDAERAVVPDGKAHAAIVALGRLQPARDVGDRQQRRSTRRSRRGEPAAPLRCGEELRFFVDDAARLFNRVLDNGAAMLFEGGQTTYPFVSSSNAAADGARAVSGVGPARDARAPSSGGRRGIRSRLSRLIDMLPTAA